MSTLLLSSTGFSTTEPMLSVGGRLAAGFYQTMDASESEQDIFSIKRSIGQAKFTCKKRSDRNLPTHFRCHFSPENKKGFSFTGRLAETTYIKLKLDAEREGRLSTKSYEGRIDLECTKDNNEEPAFAYSCEMGPFSE